MSAAKTLTANFYIFHSLIKVRLKQTVGTLLSPKVPKLSIASPKKPTTMPTLPLGPTTVNMLTIQDHSMPMVETSMPVEVPVINMQQQALPIKMRTKIKITKIKTRT